MFIIPVVYDEELTSSRVADTGNSSVTVQVLFAIPTHSYFLQFITHPLQGALVKSMEEILSN